jgi:hypothetical protein
MGLSSHMVEAIMREHVYRPIEGDVLLIGRQTVYMSPKAAFQMMLRNGITPAHPFDANAYLDVSTINRRPDEGQNLISDFSLFELLGASRVRALDHSDYEGAQVVHDLTKPIPSELRGIADFIVDGSTLDNVFDPVTAILNFAELLRPGGRIIMINMLSNHNQPYTLQTPLWYLDYFVVNHFVDCKVYVCVFLDKCINSFYLNIDDLINLERGVTNFVSEHEMAAIVVAEKGDESTAQQIPSQGHYRSSEKWVEYRESLMKIRESPRPHIVRSTAGLRDIQVRGGHLFVNESFEAVDVSAELTRLGAAAAAQKRLSDRSIFLSPRR